MATRPHIFCYDASMATIDRHYFSVCTRGYERLHGDPNLLLRKVDVEPTQLSKPAWRGSVLSMARLVRLIWEELEDEAMGFSEHITPLGSFAFAAELAMEGKFVEDGLERAIRFYNLVNSSIHTQMDSSARGVSITVELSNPEKDPDNYYSEFWMIIWHRLACWLAGETLSMVSANFDYSRPTTYFEEFKYLFPCKHKFNAPKKSFLFDKHIQYAPIRRSRTELLSMLAEAPLELMTIPSSDRSMFRRVRQLLVQNPSLPAERIAEKVNLTADQLRRQLKKEGQKISTIREFVRRDMAFHWLLTSNRSIETIAEDLGYAEARSFTRAFRSWTNLSPSKYRRAKE